MRKYRITYLKEVNDECVDITEDVTVPNIEFAIPQFKEQVRVFKRITDINELNGNQKTENVQPVSN